MEWTLLCLLVPAILLPVVLLFGFAGCDRFYGVDPVGVPPTAPVMLTGRPLSSSSIVLSWQTTDPASVRFQINRADEGGTFAKVTDQATGQSFTDTGLTEGTIYLYVVIAINDASDLSDQSNVATVSLVFKTAYSAALTDDAPDMEGYCLVQTIKAHDFNDPNNPANLANETGTILRLSLLGSLAAPLQIDHVYISQTALVSPVNPNPDPWDSASDLKLVASNVALAAGAVRILDTISYLLDPTRDLIVAFDINATPGSGNLRLASITGPAAYLRADTAQAAVQDRLPDYDASPDQLYLIGKIEVL